MDLQQHECKPGEFWRLYDANGIYCCRVCDVCEDEKRARYRPEIFCDPDYERTEALDDE